MDANKTSEPWDYIYYIHKLALAKIENANTTIDNPNNSTKNIKFSGIHCKISNFQLLINSIYINKVLEITNITHVPNQHKCIKGLANIENKLTAIIDLQYLLLSTASNNGNNSRLLLLNTNDSMPIALVVNEVYNKISLAEKDLINLNQVSNNLPEAMSEFITQAYNYKDIIYEFDINKFLLSKLFLSIGFK